MKTQTTNKRTDYAAPRIKVVSFTVEQGFAGSYRSEALTPTENIPGLENVTESETSLTTYF